MFSIKNGEANMRMLAGIVAAAALIGTASVADAATATSGEITSINPATDSIILNNGSTFVAPPKANLSDYKVGEKVTLAYVMRNGAKDATRIAPLAWDDAARGG
jgi:hypothetical protein